MGRRIVVHQNEIFANVTCIRSHKRMKNVVPAVVTPPLQNTWRSVRPDRLMPPYTTTEPSRIAKTISDSLIRNMHTGFSLELILELPGIAVLVPRDAEND
jgi:hypothetical protein